MLSLKRGTRVQADTVVDYRPYACILQGERGVIAEVDEDDIEVLTILWDIHHEGLTAWGNTTRLVPPDTSALRAVPSAYQRTRALLLKVAAVAVFALLIPSPRALAEAFTDIYTTILYLTDMWN